MVISPRLWMTLLKENSWYSLSPVVGFVLNALVSRCRRLRPQPFLSGTLGTSSNLQGLWYICKRRMITFPTSQSSFGTCKWGNACRPFHSSSGTGKGFENAECPLEKRSPFCPGEAEPVLDSIVKKDLSSHLLASQSWFHLFWPPWYPFRP